MDELRPVAPALEDSGSRDRAAGILPSQMIRALIRDGAISAPLPIEPRQVQPASIDLRLGPVAFRVRASFLPSDAATVSSKVEEFKTHEIDLTRPAVLERGCVYIVPLLERLELPPEVSGRANPKSTVGRLDVFTRLLSDYGGEFERVGAGYRGPLYAEIVPRTFSVLVRQGSRMNQLRFIRSAPTPSDALLEELHARETLVYRDDGKPGEAVIKNGLWISVDLVGEDSEIVGYRARRHAPLVDLDRVSYYDPGEFWEPIKRPAQRRLILDPDEFYILGSRERIRVPPGYAAEMVNYDPSVGEFRIHYAGFFDPGFGYGDDDIKGTRAVLEVRSHEVPFVLEDGQRVGRLLFEPLLARPDLVYGAAIGSSYQQQGLALSKPFRRFT